MVEENMVVKSLELLAFLLKKADAVCFIALIERYFKHILAAISFRVLYGGSILQKVMY